MNITAIQPHNEHLQGINPAKTGATSQHDQLVKKTEKWVSQTFYGTLLKHMHDGPYHSDMLDGGKGGKAFRQMYDQQLADRMSRGAGAKLVNTIVRKIEAKAAKAAYEKHAPVGEAARTPVKIPKDARRANLSSLLPGKIAHTPAPDHPHPSLNQQTHSGSSLQPGKIAHTPGADHPHKSLNTQKQNAAGLLPQKLAHAPAADHPQMPSINKKREHPHGFGAKSTARPSLSHLI